MKLIFIKNIKFLMPFFVISILLFVLRYDFLHLPYYWDEAWSYKPAVEFMYKNGLSLLPSSLEIYKGHPLFFYFISSFWLSVLGNNIFISKLFALFISILTLFVTYILISFFVKNQIIRFLGLFLLLSQSIFLAQSTLLLPEMLLTLLTLLSFYSYFTKNKFLYVLFTSLLLLTKETAIVAVFTIILIDIFSCFRISTKKYLKQSYYLILPFIPVFTFFIIQKYISGWFFYPEHISYIDFGVDFFKKVESYFSLLFIYQGRNIISLFILVLSIFLFIKKQKLKYKTNLLAIVVFIILYILFLSINFFSPRYILSLIPFYILIFIYLLETVEINTNYKYILLIISIISTSYYGYSHNKNNDHSLGYQNNIIVQQKLTNFLEDNNFYAKNITTDFLLKVNLTDSICGYLSKNKPFNVKNYIDKNTEFIIVCSNANSIDTNNLNLRLYKEFKKKQAWCKIYKIIK